MASIVLPEGIQLLSGLEANRASVIPDVGELLVTTDERLAYLGDNVTGGANVLKFNRLDYVDTMPVQTTPATPAAGETTEVYFKADGEAYYLTDDGNEHAFEQAIGDNKRFQVIGASQIAPSENLVVRSIGTDTVQFTADYVMARNFTKRRPYTATNVNITFNLGGGFVAGWKDIYYRAFAAGATATVEDLRIFDAGTLPTQQGDTNYYAFLGTIYIVSAGVLRPFVQKGNVYSQEPVNVVINGVDTAWTAVDLTLAVPPKAATVDLTRTLSVWAAQFTALRVRPEVAENLGQRSLSIDTRPLTTATFSNTNAGRLSIVGSASIPLITSQSMAYQMSAGNSRGSITVQGYTL